MEQPYYVLKEDKSRAVVPKLLMTAGLCIIFFFGIWLNLLILQVESDVSRAILFVSGIIFIIVIAAESIIAAKKINPYNFFPDRIEHDGRTAYYSHIQSVEISRSFFDNIFKTGTLNLRPYLKMKGVHSPDEFVNYINQLMQRAGRY